MTCHPGIHYCDYYPGALSFSDNTATHLKMGHQQMKSAGARSSNELQRLDCMTGYQIVAPVMATDPHVPFVVHK